MNILVDITHPAHVHFFRNPIDRWQQRGHTVSIVARDKDLALALLGRYGFDYQNLGLARSGLLGLGLELIVRNFRLARVVRQIKPDVMTGIGGVFIAHVGALTGVPSVVFTDTENATLSNRITFPFCSAISTPRCYEAPVPEKKHRPYAGYHELAYTHPAWFHPDPAALAQFGLQEGEPFIVLRLVSWGAAHDVRDHGFTDIAAAVRRLQSHGKVLISAEGKLPPSLEPLRITAAPEQVHQLLYHARLFIGESATMASESATLGTPAIFVSTSRRGYTNEQERRYGLTFTFSDPTSAQAQALDKAKEILDDGEGKAPWQARRDEMLRDMVDVTQHIVDLVESYAHGRA